METIALAVLGSSVIGVVISQVFELVKRKLDKKDLTKDITKRLDKLEKDSVRTQLLILLSDYYYREEEIMEVARHYFDDLHGDWYMTKMYEEWKLENEKTKEKR